MRVLPLTLLSQRVPIGDCTGGKFESGASSGDCCSGDGLVGLAPPGPVRSAMIRVGLVSVRLIRAHWLERHQAGNSLRPVKVNGSPK